MGGFDLAVQAVRESTLKYHPSAMNRLTSKPMKLGEEQCLSGSLTGAVSSQRVTEESKGPLSTVGNRAKSVNAQGGLTARPISRAGAKAGISDPVVPCGRAIA